MAPTNTKLFKDPVHGYIPVETDICTAFIDEPIFQRLRHIEQTSMRPLYPGAHHDRFIHSLGVYHLAKILLPKLLKPSDPNLSNEQWELLKRSFEIACLMHDCGHSPFSHIGENFYNSSFSGPSTRRAENWLKSLIDDDFRNDFYRGNPRSAAHEIFSAALLIKLFKTKVECFNGDALLAARMITGTNYRDPDNILKKVANCFIKLLNGTAIDLDKLDYIMRDTWASGVKNVTVDVDRLLSAIEIQPDGSTYRICFRKSALSVIQAVVDARNYLYEWIYNHHTVVYYANLLDRALTQLAIDHKKILKPDHFYETVFSINSFQKPRKLSNGINIYLPTDGDLMHLLKSSVNKPGYEMVGEILSHSPSRIPLWKTFSEYKYLLIEKHKIPPQNINKELEDTIPQTLCDLDTSGTYSAEDYLVIDSKATIANIVPNDIMINIGQGEIVSYTKIFGEHETHINRFFYVFIPKEFRAKIPAMCERICELFS